MKSGVKTRRRDWNAAAARWLSTWTTAADGRDMLGSLPVSLRGDLHACALRAQHARLRCASCAGYRYRYRAALPLP